MNNQIAITYKNGPFLNAKRALASLDLTLVQGKSVLIKPNCGRVVGKERGINTHPEAVAGVIEALQAAGAARIVVGESPIVGVNTMEAFRKSGIAEIAEKYGIALLDLDAGQALVKEIPGSRILKSTKMCADIYDFDILLSLPVAKTHMHTGVTLGIKNMKGCLYRYEKVRYHQLEYDIEDQFPDKTLDSAISDLASILLPHITVIDGYVGMEGLGPSGGDAIKSDFAVASLNPVGADVFGCLMMGYAATEIPYLRIIAQNQGYALDPAAYSVIEPAHDEYKAHIVAYKRPPEKISVQYPNVVLYDKESCSACLSTVMLFLKRFQSDMTPYLFADGKFHIGIGKGLADLKMHPDTILIGNCARKCKGSGKFVPGCPPVPTRIYIDVTGHEPEENEPDIK